MYARNVQKKASSVLLNDDFIYFAASTQYCKRSANFFGAALYTYLWTTYIEYYVLGAIAHHIVKNDLGFRNFPIRVGSLSVSPPSRPFGGRFWVSISQGAWKASRLYKIAFENQFIKKISVGVSVCGEGEIHAAPSFLQRAPNKFPCAHHGDWEYGAFVYARHISRIVFHSWAALNVTLHNTQWYLMPCVSTWILHEAKVRRCKCKFIVFM